MAVKKASSGKLILMLLGNRNINHFDWILLVAVLVLATLGLVAIYSVALGVSDNAGFWQSQEFLNVKKQAVFLVLGLVILGVVSFWDYHFWQSLSWYFYLGALALLVGVLLFGAEVRGTQGWLDLLGFRFQPIEVAKIGLLIWLASWLSRAPHPLNRPFVVLGGSLFVAIIFGLAVLQPDLGSAMIILLVWLGFLVAMGLNYRQWLLIIGLGLICGTIGWFFVLADYQKLRVETFLDPAADPLGSGYNVMQSIIAVGSGEIYGRGLGFGSQSQLKFLPESQTDFIFAVIAEELGFLGVSILLVAFGIIIWRVARVVMGATNDFALFLSLGILLLLSFEFIVNVAVNLGLAPATGIACPFVSYGGTALLSNMLMVGIVENIKMRS